MSKKKTSALQPCSFSLSSTDMLVLRITFAHLLTQIEKRYSDEDEDKQGRLLMANFLKSALEQYISNDCPIIQDKFSHTKSLSNVRNQATRQTTPKSFIEHHTKTNAPMNLPSRRSSRICYSVGKIIDDNGEEEEFSATGTPSIQSHTVGLTNVREQASSQTTPKSSAKHMDTNPPNTLPSRRSSRICYSMGNVIDDNGEEEEQVNATGTSRTDGLTNVRKQASSQNAPKSSAKHINTKSPKNLPSRRSSRICYSTGKITDDNKNREEQVSAAKTVSIQSSDNPTKVFVLGKRSRITIRSEDLSSSLKKTDRTLPFPAQKTTKSRKKQRVQETSQKSSQVDQNKAWWRSCIKRECTHRAVNNGVCVQHGAKRRYCNLYPTCEKWAIEGGVCRQHGAKLPLCRFPGGCSNLSRQGGVCTTHGAKRKYYTKVAK